MEGFKMKPEIKKLWVDALRSREYKQGRGQLREKIDDKHVTHCCLGVLCEIYKKKTRRGKWISSRTFKVGNDSSNTYLPLKVMEWAGLGEVDPVIGVNGFTGVEQTASDANDNLIPFYQIARKIERNL